MAPDAHQLLDLTAVDGSIFRAFPRMAWALWKDSEHRGVKLHLHFDVFCGTPLDASITHASGSETDPAAGHAAAGTPVRH